VTRSRARSCVAVAITFLTANALPARADDSAPAVGGSVDAAHPASPTILLIEARTDPVAVRVAAELRASGLQVASIQASAGKHTDSEIQLLSLAAGAVATIDLDADAGESRIWTRDRASGESVLRAVVPMTGDAEVVALHTVEALRTAVYDSAWGPRADALRPVASTPDRLSPRALGARDRMGASLGPAWATGSTGFGASAQALLSLFWLSRAHVGVEAMGVAPLTGSHWSTGAGSASLTFGMAAGGIRVELCSRPWGSIDAGAGLGAGILHTEGRAILGYLAMTRTSWVAAPFARIGYSVGLAGPLRLRLDVAGVIAVPRPEFTVAGENAASWGRPLVLPSVSIAVVSL
jgi:hypothetical protein